MHKHIGPFLGKRVPGEKRVDNVQASTEVRAELQQEQGRSKEYSRLRLQRGQFGRRIVRHEEHENARAEKDTYEHILIRHVYTQVPEEV